MQKRILIVIGLAFLFGCGGSSNENTPHSTKEVVTQKESSKEVAKPKEPVQKKAKPAFEAQKKIASKPSSPPKPLKENQIKPTWGNAPDFILEKVGGGEYILSKEAKGKVIILGFFATWCYPCRMGIPGFVELYNKYKKDGLEIIGASLDRDPANAIPPFVERYGINYPILIADGKTVAAYGGIRGIPTTFIIDRDGNLVKKYVGYVAKNVFEEEIKRLLGSSQEG